MDDKLLVCQSWFSIGTWHVANVPRAILGGSKHVLVICDFVITIVGPTFGYINTTVLSHSRTIQFILFCQTTATTLFRLSGVRVNARVWQTLTLKGTDWYFYNKSIRLPGNWHIYNIDWKLPVYIESTHRKPGEYSHLYDDDDDDAYALVFVHTSTEKNVIVISHTALSCRWCPG